MKKIFMGQLGVYGDCLYATTIARQIKHDNPDCQLTWAIGQKYADILDCNPYVDVIHKIGNVQNRTDVKKFWFEFVDLMKERNYDEMYFTQIYPGFPDMYWGSIRTSMFRLYGPITVPLKPVLRLTNTEVDRVKAFAEHHSLANYQNIILFECSPQSDQSFLDKDSVMKIATEIIETPGTCIILSGASSIDSPDDAIIDGSYLSFRENAELTKYCTLFVGTGSGITQICQTDWAKELPMIQLLNKRSVASIIADHKALGLPTGNIIEMSTKNIGTIVWCIRDTFRFPFLKVKKEYENEIKPDFNIVRFHMRFDTAMINGRPLDIAWAIVMAIRDYGTDVAGLAYFFSTFPASIKRIFLRHSEGVY